MITCLGSIRRILSTLILLFFCVAALPLAALADEDTNHMKLKTGFLSPVKFTFGEHKKEKVYGFSRMSFNPTFEQALGTHPPALREARRGLKWNGLAFMGTIAFLVLATKEFVDTLSDADKVSSGKPVDDSFKIGELVPWFVAGGISIFGGVKGASHLKAGVRKFNERQDLLHGTLGDQPRSLRGYGQLRQSKVLPDGVELSLDHGSSSGAGHSSGVVRLAAVWRLEEH